ncbi:MAG: hypothetical protein J6X62_02115 [Bacteroidales bacterium]|nr:hypothetical protein [Bacteroidales bacterium]
MKKILLVLVAVFGLSLAANAQHHADQCKLEGGNGGHITAYLSSTANDCRGGIDITTEPSVEQPANGKVLCRITYVNSKGIEKEVTRTIDFSKSGSYVNHVDVGEGVCGIKIKKIEIWGAECRSASRPW